VERAYRHGGSFLVDGVITMRYDEIDGKLVKLITSDKLRGSWHSPEICPYTVLESGIVVG
jgi:circadian clock protein KaiC